MLAETYIMQNFVLTLNLTSNLTSEVAPRSSEDFFVYYCENRKVAWLPKFILRRVEKQQQKTWQISGFFILFLLLSCEHQNFTKRTKPHVIRGIRTSIRRKLIRFWRHNSYETLVLTEFSELYLPLKTKGWTWWKIQLIFFVTFDPASELRGATSEVRSEARFKIYLKFYVKYASTEVRRHLEV